MRLLTYADYIKDPTKWTQCISPLSKQNLQPAGVDLTIGGIGLNLTSGEEISFDSGEEMEVRPGDFVNIQTEEAVNLKSTDFGMIFAKVTLTQRGFTSFGSKIDPGYHGRLLLSFANNGHSSETLRKGQPICMIAIMVLDSDTEKQYSRGISIPPTSRPVVTLSLDATAEERRSYDRAFSRGQMALYDLFFRLNGKFNDVVRMVNVTRRDIVVGFLTTTVPTIVIGLLVVVLTLLALSTGLNTLTDRIATAVPNVPLWLSMLATLVAIVALFIAVFGRGRDHDIK